MGAPKIKIAILTSSRADYGIYLPLLKQLSNESTFDMSIIAFGTHCSEKYGKTVENIKSDGFIPYAEIDNLLGDDSPSGITRSYAKTIELFADFWMNNSFDWVLCLGDRFEMAAAVNAGIPFGVKFAHIHGGETTLGAIDNIYRHQITLASKLHFPSLPIYKDRIKSIIGDKNDSMIKVTGSLSLDNLMALQLLSKEEFSVKWSIDLNIPTILITIHPETVDYKSNDFFATESIKALIQLQKSYQLVITMPNADTAGSIYRNAFTKFGEEYSDKVILIENFGTQSYFTCMKYAKLLLGNTSSGIIEAASFNKYVINLGDRQKGRFSGDNVIDLSFDSNAIVEAVKKVNNTVYNGENPYFLGSASKVIIDTLKEYGRL